ncbi:MAG TPA: SDR family NAD(P)-dependent oxidoreductase [Gemmatimonadaceae bacterium]|nr:SDR family NAD(P)-dependent oxidoreductase [Gemmatimonadaceae bacterium]
MTNGLLDDGERWLHGRHAVVTGGGRGIGLAIAAVLARHGADLTIMGRTPSTLDESADELRRAHGVRVTAVPCDVTDTESVRAAFACATGELGDVHVLVNNAGGAASALFGDTTRETWDHMLALNLTGSWLCTQQVMPAMPRARWGRVVNIASTAGLRGYKATTAYCAAKHGVVGLTRALALETARHGVTINAVCPGYTETDMHEQAVANLVAALGRTEEEARAMLLRTIPRGSLTAPSEVASAVAWLSSPGAAAVTGIALPVAGGEVW